jgi:hypothetical protein
MTNTREGISNFSKISAFAGALFFSALVLLINQREYCDKNVIPSIPILNTLPYINAILVTEFQIVAFFLSISIIIFSICAYGYAGACNSESDSTFQSLANLVNPLYFIGFLSFLISLIAILVIIDIYIAIISAFVIVILLFYIIKYIKQ